MDDEVASTVDAREPGRELATPADATRTAARPLRDETPPVAVEARLSAPLQTRDPDRYEILGEHGRGGLGRVFRARDKELGRDIAVKELLERGNTSEVRFLREALITARLEHPGIVPVHEAGRWPDGTPFYAMKLVSGSPLKTLIERCETMEQRLALIPNVIAVADAIAYAHDRKIIHRDLKPSNVIVGEFGETVVIDWGLAKALDEVTTTIDSPYRGSQGHELTASGSVLGTPAYMAPEQHKGLADEKTDIYALGGILFSVLTGHAPHRDDARFSVDDAFARDVPRDLVAIVRRAMATEPRHRYPTADALADDLRRYTRQLPVGARRYSIVARLGRLVARHRTASLSIAGASIAVIATLVVALVKIDRQRDDAVEAERLTESANDELVLEHGALYLQTDPSAALATVRKYRGANTTRQQLIAAEAVGRGVGELVTTQSDTIVMAMGNADGSIVSICADGRIELTSGPDTITLADDDGFSSFYAYAASKRLLVYLDLDMKPVMLDVAARHKASFGDGKVRSIVVSPDETKFATLSTDQVLTVWTATATPVALFTRRVTDGWIVIFPDPEHVIVARVDRYMLVSLSGAPDVVVASPFQLVDGHDGFIVTASTTGQMVAYPMTSARPSATQSVCRGAVVDFAIVPTKHQAAFACDDGHIGVFEFGSSPTTTELFKTTATPKSVVASFDGRLIAVTSDSTTAYVHDLDRHITSRYEGQAARLTAIAPPSAVYPQLVTGDVVGTVRKWNVHPPAARRIADLHADTDGFAVTEDGTTMVLPSRDGGLHVIDTRAHTIATRPGHPGGVTAYRYSDDDRYFVMGGEDGSIRVWSSSTFETIRTMSSHNGRINSIDFIGADGVSIANDGRLLRWSLVGDDVRELFSTRYPLVSLRILGGGRILVCDVRGNVWIISEGSAPQQIRVASSDVVQNLERSHDKQRLAIGTQSGTIDVIDLTTLTTVFETHVRGSVRSMLFDGEGARLLVATDDHDVRMIRLTGTAVDKWTDVTIDARHAMFSEDGQLVAILTRTGGVWLYSSATDRWRYANDHQDPPAINGGFSPDGKSYLTIDRSGVLVARDVAATMDSPLE